MESAASTTSGRCEWYGRGLVRVDEHRVRQVDGDETAAVDDSLEPGEKPGVRSAWRGDWWAGGRDGRSSSSGSAVEFGFDVVFGMHGLVGGDGL